MPSWWKGRSKTKSKATKSSPSADSTPRKKSGWREDEAEVDCSLDPKLRREQGKEKKASSFDGVIGARRADESAGNICDGDSKARHPLPRPFVSSPLLFQPPLDLGIASASSVSSSGSSEDTPDLGLYR